jgi:F420 biosynthesis protein FbiB-like protein
VNVYDAIRSRRSIRRYAERPVPPDVIRRVLEAAVWAPSAHNRQPWRFVIIQSPTVKTTLARAMGDRLRADRLADGDPREVVEADAQRSLSRISGAPAVIAFCLTMHDMDVYPDARRNRAEHVMAAQGAAMAMQNLLLAAHAEGLGACWLCAPLFAPDVVTSILGLPSDWEPQGLITLGYPAGEPKPKARMSVEAVTVWR